MEELFFDTTQFVRVVGEEGGGGKKAHRVEIAKEAFNTCYCSFGIIINIIGRVVLVMSMSVGGWVVGLSFVW